MKVSHVVHGKICHVLWQFGTPFSDGKSVVTVQMKHAAKAVHWLFDYIGEIYVAARR